MTDNGVHASASPFEGLAERMNWLERYACSVCTCSDVHAVYACIGLSGMLAAYVHAVYVYAVYACIGLSV